MLLTYPPLAERLAHDLTVGLVSMGCSDWSGSAAVRMQVSGGSLCCISLAADTEAGSKWQIQPVCCRCHHFIILNMRYLQCEIVGLINGELRT